jgi:hypothetical protein
MLMEQGIREANRWRIIVEHMKSIKGKTILKLDIIVKVKVTEYPESKYYDI